MNYLSNQQKLEIKVIREKTKEITRSKEAALQYLKDSGILDFVENAMKDAKNEK